MMPADPIPSPRTFGRDADPSPDLGEDGSLMLRAYDGWHADTYWLTFSCAGEHGCHRTINLGFRPAIARFGPTMTIRGIARRLRCSHCGHANIGAQVSADTRSHEIARTLGPLPETRADLRLGR